MLEKTQIGAIDSGVRSRRKLRPQEVQDGSIFVRHCIGDFARWKRVFDKHETVRREYGLTAHGPHRDAGDPNMLILAFRVDGLSRAREFARSETLYVAMEQAGVQGPPTISFADDLEDKRS